MKSDGLFYDSVDDLPRYPSILLPDRWQSESRSLFRFFGYCVAVVLLLVCLGLAANIGYRFGEYDTRVLAVKAHVGRWVCNPIDGQVRFEFNR